MSTEYKQRIDKNEEKACRKAMYNNLNSILIE